MASAADAAEALQLITMALNLASEPGYRSAPALPNRAVSRQSRIDDLRRTRAAAQPLRIAFPQLEQVRIDLTFVDSSSNSPASQAHTLYPAARAFFVHRCPHSDCDGEFELADIVRAAVTGRSHEAHGSLLCTGTRPGEKGSKRACQLQLAYDITARVSGGG